jgi:hypothetical protein
MDVDIPSCIEKAEAIIEDISVESLRLKKNITTIIVGNMILGIDDIELLKKMTLGYIDLYNSIVTAGTTAIDIIHDIENNPHKYLSLSDHIKEGADLPIIIYNNTLFINLRNIVKKYIGNARSEYDTIKIQNEFKSILGIE